MTLNTTIGDTHGVRAILNDSIERAHVSPSHTHTMFAGCVSAGADVVFVVKRENCGAGLVLGVCACGPCTVRDQAATGRAYGVSVRVTPE